MIIYKVCARVLLVSFFIMIVSAVVGGIIGGDNHPLAGTLLGGLVGYIAPCLLVDFARKRMLRAGRKLSTDPGGFWLVVAGLAANDWVGDSNRELVQSLRGVLVASFFGLIVGTLAVWGFVKADLLFMLHGAIIGATLVGFLTMLAEFPSRPR